MGVKTQTPPTQEGTGRSSCFFRKEVDGTRMQKSQPRAASHSPQPSVVLWTSVPRFEPRTKVPLFPCPSGAEQRPVSDCEAALSPCLVSRQLEGEGGSRLWDSPVETDLLFSPAAKAGETIVLWASESPSRRAACSLCNALSA